MAQPNKHDSQMAFADGSPLIGKNQGAAVTAPTGGTPDAEARTAINDIISRLEEQGIIADN